MRTIDFDNWDRAGHYAFFMRMDIPQYNVGANLDISRFLPRTKARGLAFSFAATFAVAAAINEVDAFRYRIRGERVVLHERVHPAFSYLAPGDAYFKMVAADLTDSLETFVRDAREKALRQTEAFAFADVADRDDLIYISSIPWVSFTHVTHTISLNKTDAVPRISWGKYFSENGRTLLPFNVQAHHAFVDGNHMGDLYDRLQHRLDTL